MSTLIHTRRIIVAAGANTLPADAEDLFNLGTDAINLEINNFGVYSPNLTSGLGFTGNPRHNATPAAGETIEFITRNNPALLRSPLATRELEYMGKIPARSACGISITLTRAALPVSELELLNAAAMVPQSEFNYTLVTRAKGDIVDLYNGTKNSASGKVVDYRSPDFTAAGITSQNAQRDLILATSALYHNRMSNAGGNVHVAVCLGTSNATGATLISGIAVGDRVLIGYQTNGKADYLTVSASIKAALDAAATNPAVTPANSGVALSAMYIIPYLISGTNPLPSGGVISGTQGATPRASRLMFVCLDSQRPIYEERPNFKTGIYLGLTAGYSEYGATQYKMTNATDSIGDANKVRLDYREEQYRERSEKAGRPFEAFGDVVYPSNIVQDGYYDQFNITWCSQPTTNEGTLGQFHRMTTVYIPNRTLGDATTNANYTGVADTRTAALIVLLNTFNIVNNLGNAILS